MMLEMLLNQAKLAGVGRPPLSCRWMTFGASAGLGKQNLPIPYNPVMSCAGGCHGGMDSAGLRRR